MDAIISQIQDVFEGQIVRLLPSPHPLPVIFFHFNDRID